MEAFEMSIELVCFWLFSPVIVPYFREELIFNTKCDTAQKA
jgi:hypothetical protein